LSSASACFSRCALSSASACFRFLRAEARKRQNKAKRADAVRNLFRDQPYIARFGRRSSRSHASFAWGKCVPTSGPGHPERQSQRIATRTAGYGRDMYRAWRTLTQIRPSPPTPWSRSPILRRPRAPSFGCSDCARDPLRCAIRQTVSCAQCTAVREGGGSRCRGHEPG